MKTEHIWTIGLGIGLWLLWQMQNKPRTYLPEIVVLPMPKGSPEPGYYGYGPNICPSGIMLEPTSPGEQPRCWKLNVTGGMYVTD